MAPQRHHSLQDKKSANESPGSEASTRPVCSGLAGHQQCTTPTCCRRAVWLGTSSAASLGVSCSSSASPLPPP